MTMKRDGSIGRLAFTALALSAFLLAAGCAKKLTAVDPAFVTPEGAQSSRSILISYQNLPNTVGLFSEFEPTDDQHPPGPSLGDTLKSTVPVSDGDTSLVRGVIFDSTVATQYQVFRGENPGGLRQIFDFSLAPSRRWLDSGWEKYSFIDPGARASTPLRYQARGLAGAGATASSPVSNVALNPLRLDELYNIVADFTGSTDTTLTFTWAPVPGAAGYILHFYTLRRDARGTDVFLSGAPAPIYDGKSSDLFIALLPTATGAAEGLGGPGVSRLTFLGGPFPFIIRISAFDSQGRLLGYSLGDFAWLPIDAKTFTGWFTGGYVFPRPARAPQLSTQMRSMIGLREAQRSAIPLSFSTDRMGAQFGSGMGGTGRGTSLRW